MSELFVLSPDDLRKIVREELEAVSTPKGYCPEWLTARQVAEALGVSEQTITARCRRGEYQTKPGVVPWAIHKSEINQAS